MPTRVVEAGGTRWTLAMEEPTPTGRLPWAIVQARAVDELTGEPPRIPVRIATARAGLSPRTGPEGSGLVALAGIPAEALPNLAGQPYPVPFTISADGYLPAARAPDVPQDAQFPDRFVPLRVGDVPLHREPIEIAGVVTRVVGGEPVPVAGASVELLEVWPVLPPADGSVPPEPPNVVALHPPLHVDRDPVVARLRRRNVVAAASPATTLLADAAAGSTELRTAASAGLAAPGVLAVDGDPAIAELVTIQTVEPVGAPDLPARVVLTHPLAFRHRRGATVQPMTLQAPGASRTFARAAIPGDGTVYLDALAGLATEEVAELFGGAPPRELHRLARFVATTDAAGRYRLPPLARVAQLTVRAAEGASSATATCVPDYTRRENRLDLRL